MSSYSKISIVIVIEEVLLCLGNLIIKAFINPEFDTLYILIAQIALLIPQIAGLIMQELDWKKEYAEWCNKNGIIQSNNYKKNK